MSEPVQRTSDPKLTKKQAEVLRLVRDGKPFGGLTTTRCGSRQRVLNALQARKLIQRVWTPKGMGGPLYRVLLKGHQALEKFHEAANLAAYHGDIDGDFNY